GWGGGADTPVRARGRRRRRTGGRSAEPRPAALGVPEPPLGRRLPHPPPPDRRGRATRGARLREPLRALAPGAEGRLARARRPRGGRRRALRPGEPPDRP